MSTNGTNPDVPKTADVVVIGGGVFGCSAALHLVQAGAGSVVLLERSPNVARQTTYGGAGFISLWSDGLQPELAIEQYSRSMYHQLSEQYEIGLKRVGLLSVAFSPVTAQSYHQYHLETKQQVPEGETEWLDAARVCELAPVFVKDKVAGARYWPKAIGVNAAQVVSAMAQQFVALGGHLCTNIAVLNVGVDEGQVRGVETNLGHISTPCVVVAAGAWGGQLARRVGLQLPLLFTQVSRFVTQPLPGIPENLPLLLIHDHYGMYMREYEGGLLIGTDQTVMHGPHFMAHAANALHKSNEREEHLPVDVSSLPGDISVFNEAAARQLVETLPILKNFQVKETRHGLPVRTPDMRPVVDQAPKAKGFYLMSGDNECGVTRGPGLGMLLAEWIVKGKPSVDLTPLRVDRFQ